MSTTDLNYLRYRAKVASAIQISGDSLGEREEIKGRKGIPSHKKALFYPVSLWDFSAWATPSSWITSKINPVRFEKINLKAARKEIPSWEQVKTSVVKIASFCFDTAAIACSCQGGFKIVSQVAATESPSRLLFQSSTWLLPNPCNNNDRLLKIPREKKSMRVQSIHYFENNICRFLISPCDTITFNHESQVKVLLGFCISCGIGNRSLGLPTAVEKGLEYDIIYQWCFQKKGNIPWKDTLLVLITEAEIKVEKSLLAGSLTVASISIIADCTYLLWKWIQLPLQKERRETKSTGRECEGDPVV